MNQQAYDLMIELGIATKWQEQIKPMLHNEAITREEMDKGARNK
jgi:hypothetical protein